jgi:hypothetical protein
MRTRLFFFWSPTFSGCPQPDISSNAASAKIEENRRVVMAQQFDRKRECMKRIRLLASNESVA